MQQTNLTYVLRKYYDEWKVGRRMRGARGRRLKMTESGGGLDVVSWSGSGEAHIMSHVSMVTSLW